MQSEYQRFYNYPDYSLSPWEQAMMETHTLKSTIMTMITNNWAHTLGQVLFWVLYMLSFICSKPTRGDLYYPHFTDTQENLGLKRLFKDMMQVWSNLISAAGEGRVWVEKTSLMRQKFLISTMSASLRPPDLYTSA